VVLRHESDGYSLDDKRNKLEGYGDLQDIVEKFKSRKKREDKDRLPNSILSCPGRKLSLKNTI
jgi:hypothetical protein